MTIVDIFRSRIQGSQNILVTTHDFPDADGIGSEIALTLALKAYGKNVICVNEEPLLERYRYLDTDHVVVGLNEYKQKHKDFVPDLLIVVDTNSIDRAGPNLNKFFPHDIEILYIDHHPARGNDYTEHCLNVKAAATGELVCDLIESIGVKLTKNIALPLYTAIIIDTSSFRYPNVTGKTHEVVAKLMSTGISPPEAYNGIYGTKKVPHMHLLGMILQSAQINKREDIAWITFKREDIDRYGSDVEDTHAFINHLLILAHMRVACMFRDDGQAVKISLRSQGDLDVGLIAQGMGGGGHSHSAATIIMKNGKSTEEIVSESIKKIETLIDGLKK
jgi:phosphoesterase RecJ-like protein